MTTDYLLRTDLTARVDEPDGVRVLDWAPGDPAATVQTGDAGPEFFAGWRPPRAAADLLLLGGGVYCADKTTARRGAPDGWTRRLRLRLPVANPDAWVAAGWDAALRFLTGDRWRIEAYPSARHPLAGGPGGPCRPSAGRAGGGRRVPVFRRAGFAVRGR